MRAAASIFALSLYILASARAYSDCGSEAGELIAVDIPGCTEDARCILHRNTNATVGLEFKPKEQLGELKAVVHGVVLGVEVPFALPNPDACNNCGLTCPLSSGESYKYSTTLPVLKKYPKVTVDVKWQLKDKDDKDVICVMIPAKIQ